MLGCCSVTDAGALRAQAERRLGSTPISAGHGPALPIKRSCRAEPMLGCCSVTDAGALRAQAERRLGSTP